MKKMTNEQYWMRRDRAEKMESLYDCPIVQNLVFSALLVGIFAIIYFIVKS